MWCSHTHKMAKSRNNAASVAEILRHHESEGWFLSDQNRVPLSNFFAQKPGDCVQSAAVLLCLSCDEDGHWELLLTKRSHNMSRHKGEVCLPGGMQDDKDSSVVDTALREAEEEISLHRHQVKVTSVLPPFFASSDAITVVHVVVCTLVTDKAELSLCANREVERIFWAPLRLFVEEDNHWQMTVPFQAKEYETDLFSYTVESTAEKYIIWGLTSRICVTVASIVLQTPVPFTFIPRVLVKKESAGNCEWEIAILRMPFRHSSNQPFLTNKL